MSIIPAAAWFDELHVVSYMLVPTVRSELLALRGGSLQLETGLDIGWAATITLASDGWRGGRPQEALLDRLFSGDTFELRPPQPTPIHDPDGLATSGYTPSISSIATDGTTITITGLPPAYTISRGDWLSAEWSPTGGRTVRLFRAVDPATADATGAATVTVFPRADVAVPTGATVSVASPVLLATPRLDAQAHGRFDAASYAGGKVELVQYLDEVT